MPRKNATFSDQLRKAIAGDGRTLYRLAKESGITPSVLGRFIANERGLTTTTLDKLVEVLAVELTKRQP
jgi:plasmid maintenance system antidote protein VapI